MTIALLAFLMLGSAAPAGAPGNQSSMPPWANLVPLILVFVAMYILLFLPQQRKAKQHTALIKSLKSGDKVVTTAGIVGVIVSIRDQNVTIRSDDTKLEVVKSSIQEVTERKA